MSELTVLVPTYRRNKLLSQTLASLAAQINTDFRVIVVDNDSEVDSETEMLVRSFRSRLDVVYFKNAENLGMFGNWDKAIELCQTDWCTILHDDDLFRHDAIEEFYKMRAMDRDCEAIRIGIQTFTGEDSPGVDASSQIKSGEFYYFKASDFSLANPNTGTLGIFFKKSNALKLPSFRSFEHDYGYTADYAFYWNYSSTFGRGLHSFGPFCFYRIFDNETLKEDTLKHFLFLGCKLRKSMLSKGESRAFMSIFLDVAFCFNLNAISRTYKVGEGFSNDARRVYGMSRVGCIVYTTLGRFLRWCQRRAYLYRVFF